MGFRPSSLTAFAWLALSLLAPPAHARALNSCEGGSGRSIPIEREKLPLLGEGYECRLALFDIEDLKSPLGQKTIRLKAGESEAGLRSLGDLFVESRKGRKQVRVYFKGVIEAWPGEEEATFVLMRSLDRGERVREAQRIGRTPPIIGTDKITVWIERYKLDVSCRILGLPEIAGDGRGGHSIGDDPLPFPSPEPSPAPGDGRGGSEPGEHV